MSRITLKSVLLVSLLVTLVLSLNLFVGAQDTSSKKQTDKSSQATTTSAGMLSASDKKFVMEAAHGGMMEVELGKLAAQKAMSDEVKQFGQRMADDHGKANEELMQLASTKGVMINHSMGTTPSSDSTTQPTSQNTMASGDDAKMMKKHQEMVNKMSALSGADFDRKYMEEMVKDHEKDVAAFERESTSGSDADLKAWATKTLPTLREHLQMARDINMKVKGGAKGSMNTKP